MSLKCPHCKSSNLEALHENKNHYQIKCNDCGLHGPSALNFVMADHLFSRLKFKKYKGTK